MKEIDFSLCLNNIKAGTYMMGLKVVSLEKQSLKKYYLFELNSKPEHEICQEKLVKYSNIFIINKSILYNLYIF